MDTLLDLALAAYDRMIGPELADIAVDRGKQGLKRSLAVDAAGHQITLETQHQTLVTQIKESARRNVPNEKAPKLMFGGANSLDTGPY